MSATQVIRRLAVAAVLAGSVGALASSPADAATPTCFGRPVNVNLNLRQRPTMGPDVILGTPADDMIPLAGGDIVCAGKGEDYVDRHPQALRDSSINHVRGGPGGDHLESNGGVLYGGPRNDLLRGGDRMYGGLGRWDNLDPAYTESTLLDGGAGSDDTCRLPYSGETPVRVNCEWGDWWEGRLLPH